MKKLLFVLLLILIFTFLFVGGIFYGKYKIKLSPIQVIQKVNTPTFGERCYVKNFYSQGLQLKALFFSDFFVFLKLNFLGKHGETYERSYYFVYVYTSPEIDNKARVLWGVNTEQSFLVEKYNSGR